MDRSDKIYECEQFIEEGLKSLVPENDGIVPQTICSQIPQNSVTYDMTIRNGVTIITQSEICSPNIFTDHKSKNEIIGPQYKSTPTKEIHKCNQQIINNNVGVDISKTNLKPSITHKNITGVSICKDGMDTNLNTCQNKCADENQNGHVTKYNQNVKFTLLGRICAGRLPLTGQPELRPVIGIDVVDLKDCYQTIDYTKSQIASEVSSGDETDKKRYSYSSGENQDLKDCNQTIDYTKSQIASEVSPGDETDKKRYSYSSGENQDLKDCNQTIDYTKSQIASEVSPGDETDKKRYSYSSGENQDFENSEGDTFVQSAADKFETVNVWDEEYTSLKNKLLRNDPLVNQGNELDDSFSQELDKLAKNSRKRKGKRPIFVQAKPDDSVISTSEEEFHDEFLVKSNDSIYSSVDHLYDNESDVSAQMTPEMKRIQQKLHPFAITSPSFNKAAAPAVMTTSVGHTGTVVTVSIVTKKSQNSIEHTTPTDLMSGGIMSLNFKKGHTTYEDIVTDTLITENKDEKGETEPKQMYLNVMEKLKSIETEHDDELYKHLDRTEINVQILDTQLIQNGEQKRWQCQLCSKSYTTKHNLVTHILDHNGIKPHLCMVCGKYFKQLSHLNTHMLTHDNIKPHICTVCGKEFTQISHLKRHQTVHLESRPYICDICGRGFAYPSELRTHKEKHNSEKEKCEECGEEFDTVKALKLHFVLHENREELICKYCGKVFRYPSQLKDHMITHEGSRPYICTECGMDFMKEHHLKAHEFTHSGQKPYSCDVCGRSFNQKANMMRHVLIHNATRAFKCDTCGKTFTQPQTLKAHQVVHSKTKPFQCKFCGKQFGRLHNLQGHLHMHNDTKPYSCFCGSTFTLKGNLNRHKKVKHGLDESTEDMEEQAVSFLSEMSSGRVHNEMDDSSSVEQVLSSPDSKSPRKGRKSVPRKLHQGQGVTNSSLLEESDDNTINNDEQFSKYFYNSFVDENEFDKSENLDQESVAMDTGIALNVETFPVLKSVRKRKKPERVFNMDTFEEDNVKEMSEEEDYENEDIPNKKNKLNVKSTKLDSLLKEKFCK